MFRHERVNRAILREKHPVPTVEETLQEMPGAKVFSKLDSTWHFTKYNLLQSQDTLPLLLDPMVFTATSVSYLV